MRGLWFGMVLAMMVCVSSCGDDDTMVTGTDLSDGAADVGETDIVQDLPPGEYRLTGRVVAGGGVLAGDRYQVVGGVAAGPAALGHSEHFHMRPLIGGEP